MKSLRLIAVVGLLSGVMLSCNKSNNNKPNANSTDEAADLVAASLSLNSDGSLNSFTTVTASAEVKVNIDTLCGTVWADSVKQSVPAVNGVSYTYNYTDKNNYTLNCTNGAYNHSATVASTYSGNFSNTNMSSTFSGSSNFTVSGLGKNYTAYTINGDYKRSGSFQSKADTSFSGTHSIDITLTNVTLIKPLGNIKSGGTASFTITGNMPSRGAFDYTGTIVFNGGYNATLTVNGTVYIINLATGTKKRG